MGGYIFCCCKFVEAAGQHITDHRSQWYNINCSFRYTAVCHPFYYRESLAGRTISSRVLMYVIPVIVISTIINIPKFLETELVFGKHVNEDNVTIIDISYDLTELRKDPDYIR